MIKVLFTCDKCGRNEGRVFAHDNSVVVECASCKKWEELKDKYPEANTSK